MKRWAWIPLIALLVLGAAVAVFQLFIVDSPEPGSYPAEALSDPLIEAAEVQDTPSRLAAQRYDALQSEEEREAHVRWVAQQGWATWEAPILKSAILSDPSETVQAAALEESIRLARKAGGSAPTSVVRLGLASNKGNTRAAALKAAREHADPVFVSELIQLVDENDPYAAMALNALAYTSAAEASAKITEVAGNANAERKLRERAIALLAVTKDPEARTLLLDLSMGSDESLARLAHEVLKAFD